MKLPELDNKELELLSNFERIIYKKLKELVEQSSAGGGSCSEKF
jgi:hypothetical protein